MMFDNLIGNGFGTAAGMRAMNPEEMRRAKSLCGFVELK